MCTSDNEDIKSTPDGIAYDYLFKLYSDGRDSFWSKVNYYIIIETALFGLIAAKNTYSFSTDTVYVLTLCGAVATLYIFLSSFFETMEIARTIDRIRIIESKIVNTNYIFRHNGRIDKFYKKGVASMAIVSVFLLVVLIIWIFLTFKYVLGHDLITSLKAILGY